jgi:hypothetical protein
MGSTTGNRPQDPTRQYARPSSQQLRVSTDSLNPAGWISSEEYQRRFKDALASSPAHHPSSTLHFVPSSIEDHILAPVDSLLKPTNNFGSIQDSKTHFQQLEQYQLISPVNIHSNPVKAMYTSQLQSSCGACVRQDATLSGPGHMAKRHQLKGDLYAEVIHRWRVQNEWDISCSFGPQ